jgi:hypothetical protein
MKQTIINYLKKAFDIHNIISRFSQFAISIFGAMTVYVLAHNYGQSELAQGFYSGVFFYFMIDNLNGVFRK